MNMQLEKNYFKGEKNVLIVVAKVGGSRSGGGAGTHNGSDSWEQQKQLHSSQG